MKIPEPGRELDALVAEKVMGYHQFIHGTLKRKGFNMFMEECCDECGKIQSAGQHIHPLPHFSTSIEAAWRVLEKMRTIPGYSLIDIRIGSGDGMVVMVPLLFSMTIGAIGETVPHAICLAALKAKGVIE